MKKVGIVTIYDINNFGNRLQAYALNKFISNLGYNCEQIKSNGKVGLLYKIKYNIKKELDLFLHKSVRKRKYNFKKFNKNIKFSKFFIRNNHVSSKINEEYSYFVVGSDQVWNPYFAGFDYYYLNFVNDKKKVISYAASVGVANVSHDYEMKMKKYLSGFKCISVREDEANTLIRKITNRNDIKTLLDPTMLLTSREWELVMKKPEIYDGRPYFLLYFLGELSQKRKKEINDLAQKENCKIIEILNPNDPYYISGPAEFLFLEKNAKYIFTDSFHSSVFSIIFNVPFIFYNREQQGLVSMNSRIETLISMLQLSNRWYNEKEISYENLHADYTKAYEIIDMKRKESEAFLKEALTE